MPTSDGMAGRLEEPERAGLLGGSRDPHDRRAPRVTLSGRGWRILAEAVRREALEGALDGREAERLSGLLRKPLNATGA
ncbi:MarR family winged helix-turn-helix transcriptional regulator [Streptomyces sp. MRC013]|uniref:MarR family winged helix-turn-helix transcriptional regulator n=1 Tax=Streptomyces sp. MRC013 TaxID=2898276 RepID=UPI0032EA1527